MIGEEVYHLTSGNNSVIGTVTGTCDTGRSYDILNSEGTVLRRNRSHLKPRSHDIPVLNQKFHFRTATPSQREIFSIPGPAHPPKEKYSLNNHISGPAHPPKKKYSLSQPQSILKLVIKRIGDTAYDSYIAETLVPLRSSIRPRKQTRFEGNPMTSVRHIPTRFYSQPPPPKRAIDASDPDLLIPLQLSMGETTQDLKETEAREANDTSKAHSPPKQPCGQLQAQRSDSSSSDSIAHCSTTTPSQREIFSPNSQYSRNFEHSGPPHPQDSSNSQYSPNFEPHPPKEKYSLQLQPAPHP